MSNTFTSDTDLTNQSTTLYYTVCSATTESDVNMDCNDIHLSHQTDSGKYYLREHDDKDSVLFMFQPDPHHTRDTVLHEGKRPVSTVKDRFYLSTKTSQSR